MASLVAHVVESLPAMQEVQVQSLGQKDPLEKEMATHPGITAQRNSWTEEPGSSGLQSMFLEADTTEPLTLSLNPHTDHKDQESGYI